MLALLLCVSQIPSAQAKTIHATQKDSVWEVERQAESGWQRGGTAFIVTHGTRQYVVTCKHVVEGTETVVRDGKIMDVPYKGYRVKQGATVREIEFKSMPDQDIAAAKVSGFKKTARISLIQPMIGDKVYALGFPASEFLTISEGIVNRYATFEGRVMIGHSADVYYGNSGGPLFDERGEVVGVNSMMHREAKHLYWSEIAGSKFRKFLEGL